MSNTPETDAVLYRMNGADIVWFDFARKLEQERDEALEARNECERQFQQKIDECIRLLCERDEAREQNAKLRHIAEWFANHFIDECWHLPHEDDEVHDKSVLSCCPVIEKGYQLRAELDQLK